MSSDLGILEKINKFLIITENNCSRNKKKLAKTTWFAKFPIVSTPKQLCTKFQPDLPTKGIAKGNPAPNPHPNRNVVSGFELNFS